MSGRLSPICARHGLDVAGIPWWDDLYLDIIVPTTGPAVVLDADELAEAVQCGQVTVSEAALAWREADRLLNALAHGQFPLLAASQRHHADLHWGGR